MRKSLIVLVIIVGGVLFATGIGILIANSFTQNPGTVSLPPQVAGQTIYIQLEGWRALEEFSHLHRQDFPLTAGAVGTYGPDKDVKLWVGEAYLPFMAGKMVDDMREKIYEGNSPFIPIEMLDEKGRKVYTLTGMGQKHFYFQSGKLIIWLAVDEDIAEQALSEILEYYP